MKGPRVAAYQLTDESLYAKNLSGSNSSYTVTQAVKIQSQADLDNALALIW
jgi:hypothetical protein